MRGFQLRFRVQSVKSVVTHVNTQPIRGLACRAAALRLVRARPLQHAYVRPWTNIQQQQRSSDHTRCYRRAISSSASGDVEHMSPQTLHRILNDQKEREKYQIIDVREAAELALSKLPDDKVVHLPMSQAQNWAELVAEPDNDLLDHEKPIVCLCHHGVRSLNMAMYLKQLGLKQVFNVTGGIDAYSRDVDSTVPQY